MFIEQVAPHPLIAAAMLRRTSDGLHLRVFGPLARADGVCEHSYAANHSTLDRWIKAAKARGYEWEVVI